MYVYEFEYVEQCKNGINYLSISYGIKSFIDRQKNFTCHK